MIVWMLDAVVEASEGSALHADRTVAICTSLDTAKAIAQSSSTDLLMWTVNQQRGYHEASIAPTQRLDNEPIVGWEITPVETDRLLYVRIERDAQEAR